MNKRIATALTRIRFARRATRPTPGLATRAARADDNRPGNAFPDAHVIGSPECPICTHRATAYGLGPCDAHNGDAWPTRKDN